MNIHYKADTGEITGYAELGAVDDNPFITIEALPEGYENRFYNVVDGKLTEKTSQEIFDIKLSDCIAKRKEAYKKTDAMRIAIESEARYDGVVPDYSVIDALILEIKKQYPKPEMI